MLFALPVSSGVKLNRLVPRRAWANAPTGPPRKGTMWLGLCCVRRFSKKMWRGCRDQPGGSVPGPDAATVAAPHQGDPV